MPKLFTNSSRTILRPQVPSPTRPQPPIINECTLMFDDYAAQRIQLPEITTENITSLTEKFKTQVEAPMKTVDPNLAMGEYFTIPVSELKTLLAETGDNPEFIQICNAVRQQTNAAGVIKSFPVVFMVPVKKNAVQDAYEICDNIDSIYIEAYPCPPAVGCATINLTKDVFKPTTQFNRFTELF